MRVSPLGSFTFSSRLTSELYAAGYSRPISPAAICVSNSPHGGAPIARRQNRSSSRAECAATVRCAVGEPLPERRQVVDGKRINHRQPLSHSHLDQAQLGVEGVLGDELGVEGDQLSFGMRVAKLAKLGRFGNAVVLHAGAVMRRIRRWVQSSA